MVSRTGDIAKGGIKTAVVVATTANITLSGLQTISGVTLTEGDRVLVKNQSTTTQNGIYNASATAWTRATDWNDQNDAVNGMLVLDANDDTAVYRVTFTGTYDIDTTVCTFTNINAAFVADAEAAQAAAETAETNAETAQAAAEVAQAAAEVAEANATALLAASIKRDGSNTPSANLPMNNLRHTGCGNAVNDTDYATLGQLKSKMPNRRVVTASETYTPSASVRAIYFQAVGGGGGGGGVDGQGESKAACSSGGGAGGYCDLFIDFADLEESYTITVGAAGTAGSAGANNGGTGGTTTIVSVSVNMSAGGGGAGIGMLADNASLNLFGSRGGAASGGDINARGASSTLASVEGGNRESASTSGSSFFGGGEPTADAATGYTATTYGAGGGGTSVVNATDNYAGGAGGAGVVIITEYL